MLAKHFSNKVLTFVLSSVADSLTMHLFVSEKKKTSKSSNLTRILCIHYNIIYILYQAIAKISSISYVARQQIAPHSYVRSES